MEWNKITLVFTLIVYFKYVKADLNSLEHTAKYDINVVSNWPNTNIKFGQVSAVSLDINGNVFVFHRGDHIWNRDTFSANNTYLEINKGPISEETVVVLDSATGNLIKSWGKNTFYMPHGLTVDSENNVWLTDVALHQVFKYDANGGQIFLELGVKFEPGGDENHFCKPTSVAVLPKGDFFVADGYCNSRIIKFSRTGVRLLHWGISDMKAFSMSQKSPYSLAVPHALAIIDKTREVCVADREHGRIVCFNANNGSFTGGFQQVDVTGTRIFSLAYSSIDGGKFYIVNGPEFNAPARIRGYTINVLNKTIETYFTPEHGDFKNPHDVAVNKEGTAIYVVELNPTKVHKFVVTYKGYSNNTDSRSSPREETSGNSEKQSLGDIPSSVNYSAIISILIVIGLLVLSLSCFVYYRRKNKNRYGEIY